jgi:hypothetical protein
MIQKPKAGHALKLRNKKDKMLLKRNFIPVLYNISGSRPPFELVVSGHAKF